MQNVRQAEGLLSELAESLEQTARAVRESFKNLSASTNGSDEAVSEAVAIVEDICDEIDDAARVAADVIVALTEEEQEESPPTQVTEKKDEIGITAEDLRNAGIIMDIPMEITVELGRTRKKISHLLRIGPDSVIKLEQLEGEPVDILINQTLIARGEVVVEKEKYGIRISQIVSRKERINSFS